MAKRKYDNSRRRSRAYFRSVAENARLIKRLEQADILLENREQDYVKPKSHKSRGILRAKGIRRAKKYEGTHRKERRREARLKLIPEDRYCRLCDPPRIVLNSRQWVTVKSLKLGIGETQIVELCGQKAVCIRCARELRKAREQIHAS